MPQLFQMATEAHNSSPEDKVSKMLGLVMQESLKKLSEILGVPEEDIPLTINPRGESPSIEKKLGNYFIEIGSNLFDYGYFNLFVHCKSCGMPQSLGAVCNLSSLGRIYNKYGENYEYICRKCKG